MNITLFKPHSFDSVKSNLFLELGKFNYPDFDLLEIKFPTDATNSQTTIEVLSISIKSSTEATVNLFTRSYGSPIPNCLSYPLKIKDDNWLMIFASCLEMISEMKAY